MRTRLATQSISEIPKVATGITGLDELTFGGLPQGRTTLIAGGPGSGKTLLGAEFLARGASEFNEPGVLITFEENENEIVRNIASLGFDFTQLIASKQLTIDYIRIDRSEIPEQDDWSLEGLFVRIGLAVDAIGAKRIVLDSIETLFACFSDAGTLRAELHRLFRWLKEKNLTAIVTTEKGDKSITRKGLEEYVSDCVIVLDNRIKNQISTRRLRIVKYRGSRHGTDEYPFLIGSRGLEVLPITSTGLSHEVSDERISSGIPQLDDMLSGDGFYKGSSILISGAAGTGKSTVGAHLADATCRRGGSCLYFLFEESPGQHIRNMKSVGIDLQQWVTAGLLTFHAVRPHLYGLETHLVNMHQLAKDIVPSVVIVDPISNLITIGSALEVKSLLTRLIDFLKQKNITAFFTNLSLNNSEDQNTDIGVSSLMDTWIMLRNIELSGERNRLININKSRGMEHSNQVREFTLTDHGVELLDVYIGAGSLLAGSARVNQETLDKENEILQQEKYEQQKREHTRKMHLLEAQISALKLDLETEQAAQQKLEELTTEIKGNRAVSKEKLTIVRGLNKKRKTAPNTTLKSEPSSE